MIRELLPGRVASAELFGDAARAWLFPEEEAVIANAVDKRRREFTSVRACARRALADIGVAPCAILPGERGAPRWPPGVVGSMTHCDGYRACAVALDTDLRTLGIDAEPRAPLPDGVLESVTLPEEREHLTSLAVADPGLPWDRLLFSVKESVYKAWFPVTLRWLDFHEARVELRPDGTLTADLLVDTAPLGHRRLSGHWAARDGFIATSIAL